MEEDLPWHIVRTIWNSMSTHSTGDFYMDREDVQHITNYVENRTEETKMPFLITAIGIHERFSRRYGSNWEVEWRYHDDSDDSE